MIDRINLYLLSAVILCALFTVPTQEVRAQSIDDIHRKGFTLLVNAGPGYQTSIRGEKLGLGAYSIGIGDFLKEDLAVMVRIAATNIKHGEFRRAGANNTISEDVFDDRRTAGVVATTLQYWPYNRVYVEAGPGVGFLKDEFTRNTTVGLGFIVGAGFSLIQRQQNNLLIGVEYAPALKQGHTVHSFGLTVGYQLF